MKTAGPGMAASLPGLVPLMVADLEASKLVGDCQRSSKCNLLSGFLHMTNNFVPAKQSFTSQISSSSSVQLCNSLA